MTTLPEPLEITPQAVTIKQGGDLWLVSTLNGLLHLYRLPSRDCIPVTVFIHDKGIRAHVRYMYPDSYAGSEF